MTPLEGLAAALEESHISYSTKKGTTTFYEWQKGNLHISQFVTETLICSTLGAAFRSVGTDRLEVRPLDKSAPSIYGNDMPFTPLGLGRQAIKAFSK